VSFFFFRKMSLYLSAYSNGLDNSVSENVSNINLDNDAQLNEKLFIYISQSI